jgi:hypothetical protein
MNNACVTHNYFVEGKWGSTGNGRLVVKMDSGQEKQNQFFESK